VAAGGSWWQLVVGWWWGGGLAVGGCLAVGGPPRLDRRALALNLTTTPTPTPTPPNPTPHPTPHPKPPPQSHLLDGDGDAAAREATATGGAVLCCRGRTPRSRGRPPVGVVLRRHHHAAHAHAKRVGQAAELQLAVGDQVGGWHLVQVEVEVEVELKLQLRCVRCRGLARGQVRWARSGGGRAVVGRRFNGSRR
jgi:hypothetical protein